MPLSNDVVPLALIGPNAVGPNASMALTTSLSNASIDSDIAPRLAPVSLKCHAGEGLLLGSDDVQHEILEKLAAFEAAAKGRDWRELADSPEVSDKHRLLVAHAGVEIKRAQHAWLEHKHEEQEARETLAIEMNSFALQVLSAGKQAARERARAAKAEKAATMPVAEEEAEEDGQDSLRAAREAAPPPPPVAAPETAQLTPMKSPPATAPSASSRTVRPGRWTADQDMASPKRPGRWAPSQQAEAEAPSSRKAVRWSPSRKAVRWSPSDVEATPERTRRRRTPEKVRATEPTTEAPAMAPAAEALAKGAPSDAPLAAPPVDPSPAAKAVTDTVMKEAALDATSKLIRSEQAAAVSADVSAAAAPAAEAPTASPPQPEPVPESKPEPKSEPKPEPKPEPKLWRAHGRPQNIAGHREAKPADPNHTVVSRFVSTAATAHAIRQQHRAAVAKSAARRDHLSVAKRTPAPPSGASYEHARLALCSMELEPLLSARANWALSLKA